MDDKTKIGKPDDSRINVNEPFEVQYWAEKFSVRKEQLKAAVETVGPLVNDVEKHLKK